jgi:hypothetical protein
MPPRLTGTHWRQGARDYGWPGCRVSLVVELWAPHGQDVPQRWRQRVFTIRREERRAVTRQHLEERAAYLRASNDLIEAVMAVKAAHPDYRLPDPLESCTRCQQHAAMFGEAGERICGPCAEGHPTFSPGIRHYDVRQVAADIALAHRQQQDADD